MGKAAFGCPAAQVYRAARFSVFRHHAEKIWPSRMERSGALAASGTVRSNGQSHTEAQNLKIIIELNATLIEWQRAPESSQSVLVLVVDEGRSHEHRFLCQTKAREGTLSDI